MTSTEWLKLNRCPWCRYRKRKASGELADMEFGDMCAECYWYEGEGNDER